MILTCPNCASRYLLSAQVLAPGGRRVRCSNCKEEWFQLPDPDELSDTAQQPIDEIPKAVKPIPEGSSVPALAEDVKAGKTKPPARGAFAGYLGAAAVGLIILGGAVVAKNQVVKAWLPSAGLYEMLGMSVTAPGEGLVFDRVKARMLSPQDIEIEGTIINLTKDDQYLPDIEASIRNEAGDVLMETRIEPPYDMLQGESTLPFKSRYTGSAPGADHIQLKFVLTGKKPATESGKETKTASEDGGNTPAPHADDSAHSHGGEAH